MSRSLITKGTVLPPNVNGKPRGSLEIELIELTWATAVPPSAGLAPFSSCSSLGRGCKRPKTPHNFIGSGGISVKFIWWGQNHHDGAVIKLSGSSGRLKDKLIVFRIHTNPKLFKNYLSNCEPIEIKLTANTSNLQVGTVFARIPLEIINQCGASGKEVVHTGKYRIFSPKNVQLGTLELKFKMLFYEQANSVRSSEISYKSLQDVENLGSDFDLNALKNCSRSYKSFRAENSSIGSLARSNCKSISPKILDYLSGRDMSLKDEESALEEIRATSPLNSVVNEILTDRLKSKQEDLYAKIDSLRLSVRSLSLLPAGIREVYVESLGSVGFTVECRISPNLLDNIRPRYDFDVMRFYADTFSDKSQKINFNKEVVRSVKIVRNEYDPTIVEEAYLLFTIWWRQFGSKHSRCLGTTKFEFTSLFQASQLEQTRRLPVRSCTSDLHVADLLCKVTLTSRGVHFDSDLKSSTDDDRSCHTSSRKNSAPSTCMGISHNRCKVRRLNADKDELEKSSSSNTPERSISPIKTERSNQATQTNSGTVSEREQQGSNLVEARCPLDDKQYRLLQGLLYVGSLRNAKPVEDGGYFLVCRAFWKEDVTSTDFAQENVFNFLEIFPVMNDEKFLNRARNNLLNLELWQKTSSSPEKMVGVVRLPLHQFYIAYRDSTITNHLSQAKLPVISIDGWLPVKSPLSGEMCGQLQCLLAIGTEEQLEYLKASRGLSLNNVSKDTVPEYYGVPIPVPQQIPKLPPTAAGYSELKGPTSCDAEIQADLVETASSSARRERLSDLLGSFIENLAQRLPPERQIQETASTGESDAASVPGVQIRKTSDLLDVLQKALVTPPVYNITTRRSNSDSAIIAPHPLLSSPREATCKLLLEIESALHLPRNPPKLSSKKNSKRSGTNKGKQSRLTPEEEPSAYVTFQAEEGYGQMIKSHEGLVYATHVIEKNCNPVWMKRFEIAVPADLLTNNEKRFILKVWRKVATDLAQCRLLPTPMEDSIIGFAAVDLNVLAAHMPCISGWFNIVDFNGRVNGQIKVNVQPLEDVSKFKGALPLNIEVTQAHLPAEIKEIAAPVPDLDQHNTTLSRAIKRKFTELEEITQRLRARLFDVTGEADNAVNLGDAEDAQLDEFERDINTAAEEDDEDNDVDGRQNFGWLGCVPSNIDALHSECSSTSGGDSQERIQMISEYLRRTDLNEVDEIRNPPEGDTQSGCANDNE